MAYRSLILEKEDSVAIITLNRPNAGNALDFRLMVELDNAIKEVGKDESIRAVIVTGAGRHFCSGVDLKMFTDAESLIDDDGGEDDITPDEDDDTYGRGTIIGAAIRARTIPKPVIAAVNGPVVGAGLSFCLACDMRIASNRAEFSMVFVKRGIAPDTGGSFTLLRIVGFPKACEMILTGDAIDASEADKMGLVNRVVPHEDLMKTAKELARKIAKNPPLAVAKAKADLYAATAETEIIAQMRREEESQSILLNTEDFQEAAVAFLEKREPQFKGR